MTRASDSLVGVGMSAKEALALINDPGQLWLGKYVGQFAANSKERALIEVFAYGTWKDYQALVPKLGKELTLQPTSRGLDKMRKLTLLSYFKDNKELPFAQGQELIGVKTVGELEALVIELIAGELIEGKIDERGKRVVVARACSRCIRNDPAAVEELIKAIQRVRNGIGAALALREPVV